MTIYSHTSFYQLSQFYNDDSGRVHDACGPCSNAVAIASLRGYKPTWNNIKSIRDRDKANGLYNTTGQNMAQLVNDVRKFEVDINITQFPEPINYQTVAMSENRQSVLNRLTREIINGNVCVLNVANGAGITNNEPGVQWHFVTVGGYDSDTQKFLISNGDETPQDNNPTWVGYYTLYNAVPAGIAIYDKKVTTMIPTGWKDDGTTLSNPQNSIGIRGGIRYFILSQNSWDPTNYPLEEIHGNDTDGYYQTYLKSMVSWNPRTFGKNEALGPYYMNLQKTVQGYNSANLQIAQIKSILGLTI